MTLEDPFGYSLALADGDLVFEAGGLGLVSGKHNLLQALELRVLTPFGSDMFNTSYGLDVERAFTEPGGVRMAKELIKLNLVRTLATDPRVRDIRQVLFEDDPEYIARHPDLTPDVLREHRRLRTWRVEVIIDTVNDDTETLALEIGV
jgi:hypothetical protein